jgi:hypothetical protein
VPLLYDAVALGMGIYTRTAFRVATLGGDRLRLRPGTILVVTHRRETDVPLVCPSIYSAARMWADRRRRIAFAAREDMHVEGFFAGFPPRLPIWARRLAYPIEVGPLLRTSLLVYPIGSASLIRLHDVFRDLPDLELEAVLGPGDVAAFRERAAAAGLPEPRRGADVTRGEYADLTWRTCTRDELPGPEFEAVWSRRAAAASAAFRDILELVRRGGVVMVYPEGRPSPDGGIGPLRPGLEALVRRGRPRWLQPIGVAYDPLVDGRTRAVVSFDNPVPADGNGTDEAMLALMRHALPLTAGQAVAHALSTGRAGADETEAALAEAVASARAEGRNVEPGLGRRDVRRARAAEALAAARRDPEAVVYLAREFASARGLEVEALAAGS